jgi:hypothetical protein
MEKHTSIYFPRLNSFSREKIQNRNAIIWVVLRLLALRHFLMCRSVGSFGEWAMAFSCLVPSYGASGQVSGKACSGL